jgi:hypothetical protein
MRFFGCGFPCRYIVFEKHLESFEYKKKWKKSFEIKKTIDAMKKWNKLIHN